MPHLVTATQESGVKQVRGRRIRHIRYGFHDTGEQEVGEQVRSRTIPSAGLLLQQPDGDQLQVVRDIQAIDTRGYRKLVQVLVDHRAHIVPDKGLPSGEHLIQNDAKGVEIGSAVHVDLADLFRRHVVSRAGHLALHRVRHFVRPAEPRRAQVQDLHEWLRLRRQQHQIPGLYVPVNHPSAVNQCERVADLPEQIPDQIRVLQYPFVHRAVRRTEDVGKRNPIQILHGEIRDFSVDAGLQNRHDVRMIERGEETEFAVEPRKFLGAVPKHGEELEREHLPGPAVRYLVDIRAAASSDALDDVIPIVYDGAVRQGCPPRQASMAAALSGLTRARPASAILQIYGFSCEGVNP